MEQSEHAQRESELVDRTSNIPDETVDQTPTPTEVKSPFLAPKDMDVHEGEELDDNDDNEYIDTGVSLGKGFVYYAFILLYGGGKYKLVPLFIFTTFVILMGSNIYHQVTSSGEQDVAPYNISLYVVYTSMVAANLHFGYYTLKRNMIGELLKKLPTNDYKGRNTRADAMKKLTQYILLVFLASFLANFQKIFPQLHEVFHYEGLFFNSTEFNPSFFALVQLGFVVNMYAVDYMLIMVWLWYCWFTMKLYRNRVIKNVKNNGLEYAISGKLMEDFLVFFTELNEENRYWYLNHIYRSISAVLVAVVTIRQIYYYADEGLWLVAFLYLYLFLFYYISIWATFITAGLANERMENELFHTFHFLKPRNQHEATLLLLYETQITNSFKDYSGLRVAGLRITTKLGIILGSGTIIALTTLVRLKIIG